MKLVKIALVGGLLLMMAIAVDRAGFLTPDGRVAEAIPPVAQPLPVMIKTNHLPNRLGDMKFQCQTHNCAPNGGFVGLKTHLLYITSRDAVQGNPWVPVVPKTLAKR